MLRILVVLAVIILIIVGGYYFTAWLDEGKGDIMFYILSMAIAIILSLIVAAYVAHRMSYKIYKTPDGKRIKVYILSRAIKESCLIREWHPFYHNQRARIFYGDDPENRHNTFYIIRGFASIDDKWVLCASLEVDRKHAIPLKDELAAKLLPAEMDLNAYPNFKVEVEVI